MNKSKNETKTKEIRKGKQILTIDDKGLVRKVRTVNVEPSLTQQSYKDEVNVNKIIAKYRKTGFLSHVKDNPGSYADLSNVGDYQEALNKVIRADSLFNDLPSELRKEFGNDPRNLVAFMADSANEERARELGLLSPLADDSVQPVAKTAEKATEEPPKA